MFFICDTSSDSSDENNKENLILQRKLLRLKSDIFKLPDNKFECYLRLNKADFNGVLETQNNKIGNMFKISGTGFVPGNLALSQPADSKMLAETLDVLEMTVCPQWIKFEMSDAEKNEAT